MSAAFTWVDGVAGHAVPADDRGLHYGDGLFETILLRNGTARFLAAHLARLAHGLARLGIVFRAEDELRSEIARAVAQAPALAVLKIIVTRGSARRRGYAPADEQARRIVSLWPAVALANADQGVTLRVAGLRLATPSPLAGLKHLNRLENVLAAAEDPSGAAFDALLLDTAGRVVSGTSSNVFVVKSGAVLTPAVDSVGVAGVMRGVVLREARHLGIEAREAQLTLEQVFAADEAFITNARIGVVPVRRVREHGFAMSDLSLKLRRHIEGLDA